MNGGVISCLDTSTGDRIQQVRLRAPEGATDSGSSRDGGGSSRGGSRFGGGRRGGGFGADYGSPILVGEKIYVFNRKGLGYVVAANDELEQIGGGVLSDGGEFSGSPAVVDDEMFVRSTKRLYCIAVNTSEK
ncbi:MAG: hypothetical protein AAFP69_16480 [Planctomycetota bacterium]